MFNYHYFLHYYNTKSPAIYEYYWAKLVIYYCKYILSTNQAIQPKKIFCFILTFPVVFVVSIRCIMLIVSLFPLMHPLTICSMRLIRFTPSSTAAWLCSSSISARYMAFSSLLFPLAASAMLPVMIKYQILILIYFYPI